MRECKIVHINDGRPETVSNGNFYFEETYPRAEESLNEYLSQGYEIRSMVPLISPGEPGGKGYAFYRSGFVFYLEREVPDPDDEPMTMDEDPEEWEFDETDLFDEDPD